MSNVIDYGLPDVFICELTKIEPLGTNNRRLVFTVPSPEFPDQRQIVARIIVPTDYLVTLGALILGHNGASPSTQYLAAFDPAGEPN
ncbi:hypothetical protein QY049_37510 [Bradyrhizobium sp. WYCCWR 13022]|uniref:hypothetical protein n=1 Tax=unclassified Bradyrhizobium TaxID=2631580 RepID=UPI00263AE2A4|nr:hypothetical protein [Bradyrhizobium sp. WYCCWR 13022]MDN4988847.1 hypothetical protein [Bradyrhizobium sp. WYCCWR 13022]